MIDNFFDISDLSLLQFENIIFDKTSSITLKNKSIGMLYEKPSTRTRLSFSVGVHHLGGKSIDIKFNELNFSRQESLEDTFRAFGCYLDGLVFRTSSHHNLILASNLMKKPVINALSDKSHPCQTLADLITLYERFNTLDLQISWFGDVNNVLFSLIEATNLLNNLSLNIFSHSDITNNINWKLGSNIKIYNKIEKSVISNSDCIMTDVFVSMNDHNSDHKKNLLKDFQVNNKIMNMTNNKCVFMHCLPAKIGSEVTKDVIEGPKSIVWRQAYNRLPAQKRLMQCINW